MENQLMGLREYARHRQANGLPGRSLKSVQKAIATKRIETVRDARGRIKINPALADIQWMANTDPRRSARARAIHNPTHSKYFTNRVCLAFRSVVHRLCARIIPGVFTRH